MYIYVAIIFIAESVNNIDLLICYSQFSPCSEFVISIAHIKLIISTRNQYSVIYMYNKDC